MKDKLNCPHDTGYKYLLSYQNVFLELLDSFVDQGWVKQLDRNQIIRVDKSFVLPKFVKREADLIYRLKENDREVIFYLLLELQARVDCVPCFHTSRFLQNRQKWIKAACFKTTLLNSRVKIPCYAEPIPMKAAKPEVA
ncbi:MAG: Rpn family recombination-promoting nuclease/putative transposase [Bacillota bacterium]|jgi:hypothetical protein